MIAASMVLVVVGVVALLLGLAGVGLGGLDPLTFVYAAIALALLAGVLLIAGVVRSRPSPAPAPGDRVGAASWSGAATPSPEPSSPAEVEARLRTVPDAGPEVRAALLDRFGSHAALAQASVDDLAAVEGVSPELAARIHAALRR